MPADALLGEERVGDVALAGAAVLGRKLHAEPAEPPQRPEKMERELAARVALAGDRDDLALAEGGHAPLELDLLGREGELHPSLPGGSARGARA